MVSQSSPLLKYQSTPSPSPIKFKSNADSLDKILFLLVKIAPPLLGKITVPTVIIHGALDHICPVGAAYYLNSQIPGSMLHIFPTAAHAPHLTHPDQVGARLSQFLRGEIEE